MSLLPYSMSEEMKDKKELLTHYFIHQIKRTKNQYDLHVMYIALLESIIFKKPVEIVPYESCVYLNGYDATNKPVLIECFTFEFTKLPETVGIIRKRKVLLQLVIKFCKTLELDYTINTIIINPALNEDYNEPFND